MAQWGPRGRRAIPVGRGCSQAGSHGVAHAQQASKRAKEATSAMPAQAPGAAGQGSPSARAQGRGLVANHAGLDLP